MVTFGDELLEPLGYRETVLCPMAWEAPWPPFFPLRLYRLVSLHKSESPFSDANTISLPKQLPFTVHARTFAVGPLAPLPLFLPRDLLSVGDPIS